MWTHQTRRWKGQKDGTSYISVPSADKSVLEPVVAHSRWVCDQDIGKEMNAGGLNSISLDPVEALSHTYVRTVEGREAVSAPLDFPLPVGCLNSNASDDSALRDWWSDYDAFQQKEDDQASGLSPWQWPWTMGWYSDVQYQEDSNSSGSIASPFIQIDDQLGDSRPEYDEEAAATPWLPQDCSFSPSSDSTQSFRCPLGSTRASSSETAIQMKSICPKPILPCPREDEENRHIFNKDNIRKGEPQTRRRSTSADRKDTFLVQSKLAGMSYKQIKEEGQFVEAESTLRGRFRTLTKHKEHRVRKPEWHEGDVGIPVTPDPNSRPLTIIQVQLLVKAVQAVMNDTKTGRMSHHCGSRAGRLVGSSKIPWKQVAEYIWENGGSYHFGNATCRKKWDETRSLRL